MQAIKNDKITRYLLVITVLVGCCAALIWLSVLGKSGQPSPLPPQTSLPVIETIATPTKTEAYRLKVSENMVLLANAFAILDPLLQNPQLDNEDWILAITVSIESVRKSHEEIIRAEPPPEMLNLHSFIMDATGDCKESMDFLTDAIHRRNQESTVRAKDLLLSCNQKLTKANQEVQEFH